MPLRLQLRSDRRPGPLLSDRRPGPHPFLRAAAREQPLRRTLPAAGTLGTALRASPGATAACRLLPPGSPSLDPAQRQVEKQRSVKVLNRTKIAPPPQLSHRTSFFLGALTETAKQSTLLYGRKRWLSQTKTTTKTTDLEQTESYFKKKI